MKTTTGKTVFVFDDPETFDRYTIITENADVFGASTNPYTPDGFGQFCFNLTDHYYKEAPKYIKKSEMINCRRNYLTNGAVGSEIKKFDELPEMVQKYIIDITE